MLAWWNVQLALLLLRPECSGKSLSMPLLLLFLWRNESDHQRPLYWLRRVKGLLSFSKKYFNMCLPKIDKWHINQIYVAWTGLETRRVKSDLSECKCRIAGCNAMCRDAKGYWELTIYTAFLNTNIYIHYVKCWLCGILWMPIGLGAWAIET